MMTPVSRYRQMMISSGEMKLCSEVRASASKPLSDHSPQLATRADRESEPAGG